MCDPPLNSSHEVWPSPFGAHFQWWPSSLRSQPSPPKKKRTFPNEQRFPLHQETHPLFVISYQTQSKPLVQQMSLVEFDYQDGLIGNAERNKPTEASLDLETKSMFFNRKTL